MATTPEVITFPGKSGVGAGRPVQQLQPQPVANLDRVLSGLRDTDFSHTYAYSISEIWEAQNRAQESCERIAEIYAYIKGTADTLYDAARDIDQKFTGQTLGLKELQTKVAEELSGVGKVVDHLNTTIGYIKRYQNDMTAIVERMDDALASAAKKVSNEVSQASDVLIGDGGVIDTVERRLIGANGVTERMSSDADAILARYSAAMIDSTGQVLGSFDRKLVGSGGIAERTADSLSASTKKMDADLAETTKAAREAVNRIAGRAKASHEETLKKVNEIEQSISRFKGNLGFIAMSAFLLVAAGAVMGAILVCHFSK